MMGKTISMQHAVWYNYTQKHTYIQCTSILIFEIKSRDYLATMDLWGTTSFSSNLTLTCEKYIQQRIQYPYIFETFLRQLYFHVSC